MKKSEKSVSAAPEAFYLVSLGCHKNLVDSEVIAGRLATRGYAITFDPEAAGIYLINTCAFLPAAREEAAAEIERALQWKAARQGRRVVVAGCLTEYDRRVPCRKRWPGVDCWLGVNDLASETLPDPVEGKAGAVVPTYLYDHLTPRLQLTVPHVAYLKIADGCNNCCTYCAIPGLRGRLRSRTADSVVAEAGTLIANGVRELVVIAQDITAFGMDRPESGENLTGLLRRLGALEGDFVIRLLYTHPAHFSDELIALLGEGGRLLPYVDMPLQHISDRILRAMNRHVDAARIREIIAALRAGVPDLTLRTTFITGFPGESEAEFQELSDFVRDMRFERMGVFPFSAEPGTAAAALPGQIAGDIASARAAKLMKSQEQRMKRRNRALVGTVMPVLVDECCREYAWARGASDAPEIDNAVYIERPGRVNAGEFRRVEIIGTAGCNLIGKFLKGKQQ